jgi:lipoprotein-anchoring transpeptidase ErfK/SrfK
MRSTRKLRRPLLLALAALLAGLAVFMVQADAASLAATRDYGSARQQLDRKLDEASRQGYTQGDLQPVYGELAAIQAAPEPVWVADRPAFYRQQLTAVSGLLTRLDALEAALAGEAAGEADRSLSEARARIDRDRQLGVEDSAVRPLDQAYQALAAARPGASGIADLRDLKRKADALTEQATEAGASQEAENAAVRKAADELKARAQGSLDAIRNAGQAALAQGRDDATSASFLDAEGRFTGIQDVDSAYRSLERYAAQVGSSDPDQAALGAAAAQRYGGQVRAALLKGMPSKAIIVSLADQELWAYDSSKLLLDTVVTTGRPALPTDVGPMEVLWKAAPWTMRSPWPKGSPFWYPDTPVRKVLWFTASGEGLHDASWRTWYGPGSQLDGSHGCVNMPGRTVDVLYGWADSERDSPGHGTPVIVIPGDGSPRAEQLKRDTIDSPEQAAKLRGA